MKSLFLTILISLLSISLCHAEMTTGYRPVCDDPKDDIRAWLYSSIDDLEDAQYFRENGHEDYDRVINELNGRIFAFKLCLNILCYPNEKPWTEKPWTD